MLFIVVETCCKAFTTIGNNQEIMQNNVEAQHKHMYSLYIGSLCNIALSMARFTCIVTLQVFVKTLNAVRLPSFYRGRENIYE